MKLSDKIRIEHEIKNRQDPDLKYYYNMKEVLRLAKIAVLLIDQANEDFKKPIWMNQWVNTKN